jgi:hypothetical protein
MSIVSCPLDRSRSRIDIDSNGEILPDSIQKLKSALRTTTPTKVQIPSPVAFATGDGI